MLDTNYIKSWAGLLKIGEFFALLIAFSCLADFANKSENNGGFKFFLFATITAWLMVMALFGLFVTQTHERISINWTLTMLIFSGLEAFLILIASSVVAEKARKLRRGVVEEPNPIDTCDLYSDHGRPCSYVEAAVVFGFLAVALFLADAVFYFIKYRSLGDDYGGIMQQGDKGGTDNKPDVEQIP